MKKLFLCFFIIFSILINYALGQAWDISLLVNDRNLDFQLQHPIYAYLGNPLYVGGEFLYTKEKNKDKDSTSWLFYPYLLVEDFYKQPVDIGIGFKMNVGKLDFSNDTKIDVLAVGFVFKAELSIQEFFSEIPLYLTGKFTYSPEILSFEEVEREFDVDISLAWKLNSAASLIVDYKFIKIETSENGDWEKDPILIGTKISF
jgi:hypothetical protein